MDLNCLYSRHQVSLMRAGGAACAASRSAHASLANRYAAQIRSMQQRSGATFRFSAISADAAGRT